MTDNLADRVDAAAEGSASRDAAPKPTGSGSTGKGSSGSGSSSSSSKGKGGRKGGRRSLRDPLTELLTTLGLGVSVINGFDGQVIIFKAETVARELDDLARQNPQVHRVLSQLVAASAWGSVATVLASVAVPIAMNHGAIPANPLLVGAFVPDELVPLLDPPTPPEPAEPSGDPADNGHTG